MKSNKSKKKSGAFAGKNTPNSGKQSARRNSTRAGLWVLIAALALLLVALGVFLWFTLGAPSDSHDVPAAPGSESQNTEPPIETTPLPSLNPDIQVLCQLDRGMQIVHTGLYTGAYMEDGTDEVVTGVLMITVRNAGQEAIEYARILMPTPDGTAEFSLSTLFPGDSVVLLEKNRMAYTGREHVERSEADTIAVFRQIPTLCEDQLQLQVLDGCINVTNISGADISGDVVIYYKNSAQDLYYGGITYRVRIAGGMKAGEVKQLMTSHFTPDGSTIVFVTVG